MMWVLGALLLMTGQHRRVDAQADGNPHGWDRIRRCDQQDYEVPCGPCEGVGGIPYGSNNDEIYLTSCEIVGRPEEMPTPAPIVWGTQWTLPIAYEVLIGKKTDPFCFQAFPGNDSVGELCYRKQTGPKYYDMLDSKAFRQDLELETPVGNISSIVLHQGTNFWVVNHLPWYAGGIHQCICTHIREGFDGTTLYYPVQYNWVEKMVYMGRERLGIEYINEVQEVDHWAFGPHHLWTHIETGNIVRMWQPFNGLQIYPDGVGQSTVDSSLFTEIPPALCKAGGALFRIGCDDDGFPADAKKSVPEARTPLTRANIKKTDLARAHEKVPRGHYKGLDFGHMSDVLNTWINTSVKAASPCSFWKVEEIQQLQALLYLARESQFDMIYNATQDNRRLRQTTLKNLESNWRSLNDLAKNHPDKRMQQVRRDGHCHEAVMWYVHHLTEEMKEVLGGAGVPLPLLSPAFHHGSACQAPLQPDAQKICDAYMEQVTCASCHSNVLPSK